MAVSVCWPARSSGPNLAGAAAALAGARLSARGWEHSPARRWIQRQASPSSGPGGGAAFPNPPSSPSLRLWVVWKEGRRVAWLLQGSQRRSPSPLRCTWPPLVAPLLWGTLPACRHCWRCLMGYPFTLCKHSWSCLPEKPRQPRELRLRLCAAASGESDACDTTGSATGVQRGCACSADMSHCHCRSKSNLQESTAERQSGYARSQLFLAASCFVLLCNPSNEEQQTLSLLLVLPSMCSPS